MPNLLVAGGTGSIGSAVIEAVMDTWDGDIWCMSRDDSKQAMWRGKWHSAVNFVIGDVRIPEDCKDVIRKAKVDFIVNCAALKHVLACERNPRVAYDINAKGAFNLWAAAEGCEHFLQVSTDKAVYPTSVLGTTKAEAERILLQYPNVSVVRFGNVVDSRGSVLPIARKQLAEKGYVEVTDKRMKRWWIDITDAAAFIIHVLDKGLVGQVNVPSCMKEIKLVDFLRMKLGKRIKIRYTKPIVGEKLREKLWWAHEKRT